MGGEKRNNLEKGLLIQIYSSCSFRFHIWMTSWGLLFVLQRRFSWESCSSPKYWLDCRRSWKFYTWTAEASALKGKQVTGKDLLRKQKNLNFTEVTQFFIAADERVMNVLPLYRRLNSHHTHSHTHTHELWSLKSVRQVWSNENSPTKHKDCWVIDAEYCLYRSGGRSCSLFQRKPTRPTDSRSLILP